MYVCLLYFCFSHFLLCYSEASRSATTETEILKKFVERLRAHSQSRDLDIVDVSVVTEGEETHIFVDRQQLLISGVEEIVNLISNDSYDPRHPLCVSYHGEGRDGKYF